RHQLHQHPKLNYQKQQTNELVTQMLTNTKLQIFHTLTNTNVINTLKNNPDPIIGLRTDINTLPITKKDKPQWKSNQPDIMHTYSHDK
ncbi:amidohydrolase, partial [Bacillus sp. MBGLi97]